VMVSFTSAQSLLVLDRPVVDELPNHRETARGGRLLLMAQLSPIYVIEAARGRETGQVITTFRVLSREVGGQVETREPAEKYRNRRTLPRQPSRSSLILRLEIEP
jgi:hypothetical protein